MKQISMKDKNGLWIKRGSLSSVLKTFLFNLGEPKEFTTSDLFQAESLNWFTYGFFDYIFKSYNIYVREAFVERMKTKTGRRWF
jgi:hypothetical protein